MKTFFAFLKKEGLEQLRTGRLLVLLILFALFGILNPAIAKLTPWMLQTLSGSMAESGIVVTNVTVDALTSWTQFYKNLPIALLIFVLMTAGAFTAEYQKGTLIPVLTKGLSRIKVLAAKALTLTLLWTACYSLCSLVTYGYTAYFWDQSAARHIAFAAGLYWLFGLWIISVMTLCSALASGNTGVLLGTGGTLLAAWLLSLLPGFSPYLPLYLTGGMALLTGALPAKATLGTAAVAAGLAVINLVIAALAFRKRNI
jgi:ABC-2 type transport system permease protein